VEEKEEEGGGEEATAIGARPLPSVLKGQSGRMRESVMAH
jgi:hypothetical protein